MSYSDEVELRNVGKEEVIKAFYILRGVFNGA